MQKPYELVLDIWEGNPDLDPLALLAEGIAGQIVRLNHMSGGHHMDEQFARNWALAQQFPVQSVYFVYNPWVSGETNYTWLMTHLPVSYGHRRLLVDVEVEYNGYPPRTYGAELATFLSMTRAHFPVSIYSGGGYLDILTPWPEDHEYWWAGYANVLLGRSTWDAYKTALAGLDFGAFTKLCPGTPRMWQCSGDGVILPGFGGHAVDVSVFPGTLDDLRAWFNVDAAPGGVMAWKDKPLGIVVDQTMAVDFAKLAQSGAAFVVIEAGVGFDYNPSLGAQIGAAHAAGLPVVLQYVPYPAIVDYTMPGVPDDLFAKFWPTIQNRQFEGLIVSVERWWTGDLPEGQAQMPRDYAGEVLIDNTAHELVNRFTQKLAAKGAPVMLRTNDNFVQSYCKALSNWSDNFGFFLADWRYRMPNPTDGKYTLYYVYQATPTPVASLEALRAQLPPDAAKTPLIPGSAPKLKFWEFSGMRFQLPFVTDWNAKPKSVKTVLFNGTKEACWQTLANWQGTVVEPPPVDPPPTTGDWETARTAGYAWVDAIIKAAKG